MLDNWVRELREVKRYWKDPNCFSFSQFFFSVHSDLHQVTEFGCGFVHCCLWQMLRGAVLFVACILRRMFCIVLPTDESQKRNSFWAAPYLLFIAVGAGAVCLELFHASAVGFLCHTALLLPATRSMGSFSHGASVHSWARHLPFL